MRVVVVASLFVAGCSCGGSHLRDDAGVDAPVDGGRDAFVCIDEDGDGISDEAERRDGARNDADGDGVPNERDLDSDGDGVSDHDESEVAPTSACRRAAFCCEARFLTPDSDYDGIPDADDVATETSVCDADRDEDGCPDGETCGAALAGVVVLAYETSRVTVEVELPAALGAQAIVDLAVAGGEVGVVQPRAIGSSPPSGSSVEARFTDVPAGARLEIMLYAGLTARPDPGRYEGTLRLLDGAGAVLVERPLLVVVPECPPIAI